MHLGSTSMPSLLSLTLFSSTLGNVRVGKFVTSSAVPLFLGLIFSFFTALQQHIMLEMSIIYLWTSGPGGKKIINKQGRR